MGKQKSQQKKAVKGLQALAELKSSSFEAELPSDSDNSPDESWEMPTGKQIPLQMLKLADCEGGAEYQRILNYQTSLKDLQQITSLQDRLQAIRGYLTSAQNDKEWHKTLKRLSNNPDHNRPWKNTEHCTAIETELLKLSDQRIREVLNDTAKVDQDWQALYTYLSDRVESLAVEVGQDQNNKPIKAIVQAEFPWRIRVGGLQGFNERLLPVMHSVYGIPYIPASSIKGMIRAWACLTDKTTKLENG